MAWNNCGLVDTVTLYCPNGDSSFCFSPPPLNLIPLARFVFMTSISAKWGAGEYMCECAFLVFCSFI